MSLVVALLPREQALLAPLAFPASPVALERALVVARELVERFGLVAGERRQRVVLLPEQVAAALDHLAAFLDRPAGRRARGVPHAFEIAARAQQAVLVHDDVLPPHRRGGIACVLEDLPGLIDRALSFHGAAVQAAQVVVDLFEVASDLRDKVALEHSGLARGVPVAVHPQGRFHVHRRIRVLVPEHLVHEPLLFPADLAVVPPDAVVVADVVPALGDGAGDVGDRHAVLR